MANGYVEVPPPTRTPIRYGLLSVAEVRPVTDNHRLRGVKWVPESCDHPSVWPDPCDPNAADPPEDGKCLDCQPVGFTESGPIHVYGSFNCPLVGFSLAEAQRRARNNLLNGEQHTLEQAVMSGVLSQGQSFRSADTVYAGVATCAAELLELLYAHTDVEVVGEPVFHMPRPAAAWLLDRGTLRVEGERLVTQLGTPVAAGSGYTEANTSPADEIPTPDGAWWVYATGPVVAERGPVMDLPAPAEQGFNPTTNDHIALAERTWVVGWDCTTVGVQFTPDCP